MPTKKKAPEPQFVVNDLGMGETYIMTRNEMEEHISKAISDHYDTGVVTSDELDFEIFAAQPSSQIKRIDFKATPKYDIELMEWVDPYPSA